MRDRLALAMTLALYLAVTFLFLEGVSRWLLRISIGDRLVLGLMPLVETLGAMISGKTYAPIDLAWLHEPLASMQSHHGVSLLSPRILHDQWCQMIPWREAVRAVLAEGEWPLWNPFVSGGEPLLAAYQPAVLHPIHLLSLLLPLPESLAFVSAATLALSAVSMYLASRAFGVRPEFALFAGAAWSYGAFQFFWLGWPIGLAGAGVPLLIFAVKRTTDETANGSALILAVAWALLLLGGNPEAALMGALFAGLLFLGLVIHSDSKLAAFKTLLLGTALGLALGSIQLLPFLDALPQTAEYAARKEHNAAGQLALPPSDAGLLLLENVLTFALGVDEPGVRMRRALEPARATSWIGSVGLAAALFALATARFRGRLVVAALLVCGAGLAAFLPGFVDVAQALPGLELVRPRYGALWSALAITLLAAVGLEKSASSERGGGFIIACIAAAGLIGAALMQVVPRLGALAVSGEQALRLTLAALVPLALVLLVRAVGCRPALVAVVAIGGLLIERQIEMGGYYRAFPANQFYPAVPPLDRLANWRGDGRFVALGQAVYPNLATMWGLEDVRGYDPMSFAPLVETYPIWAQRSFRQTSRVSSLSPFLSFLNVRYALTSPNPELVEGWQVMESSQNWVLLENLNAMPRIFSPQRVRLGGTKSSRLSDLASRTDFHALAWIEPMEGDAVPGEEANGPCATAYRRRGTGHVVTTDCQSPAWVVTSIPAWRGWRAEAGGEALATAVANHAFFAFRAPPGRQEIILRYLPSSFLGGAALSALAAILFIVMALRHARARRRD